MVIIEDSKELSNYLYDIVASAVNYLVTLSCLCEFDIFILNHPCITSLDTEGDGHESAEEYTGEVEYSEEDVEQALNQLKQYYGLWKPIGIELGIDVGVISDIGRDHKGEFSCLQAMIKQYPHSDNPTLTYKALLQALRSERVNSATRGMQNL